MFELETSNLTQRWMAVNTNENFKIRSKEVVNVLISGERLKPETWHRYGRQWVLTKRIQNWVKGIMCRQVTHFVINYLGNG